MSARKKELVKKVRSLIDRQHNGDYNAAFQHYARSGTRDAQVDRWELIKLLRDAGVGNGMTRGLWATGVMDELDSDGDGKISPEEFRSAIER